MLWSIAHWYQSAPLAVGLLLLVSIAVLDQFVAPQLQQKAISSRAVALEKSAALGKTWVYGRAMNVIYCV